MIPFPNAGVPPTAQTEPDDAPALDLDLDALRQMGAAARESGRLGRAAALLGRAVRIAHHGGDPLQIGEVLRDRGDLRLRQGDAHGAVADWRSARERFVEGNATGEIRAIDARLAALPGGAR